MRPDEHKKKKNAKYRKKHGLDSSQTTNNSHENESKTSSASNSDTNNTETDSKKVYTRRVLSSNWEKYEEQIEQIEQIGDDFEQVVSSAGGASSHRLLESEKEWGVDQNLDEILSIDFKQLAPLLLQIPFCERLGLDENLFEPTLLKLINEEKHDTSSDSHPYPPLNLTFSNYEFDFKPPPQKDSSLKVKSTSSDNSQEVSRKTDFKDSSLKVKSTSSDNSQEVSRKTDFKDSESVSGLALESSVSAKDPGVDCDEDVIGGTDEFVEEANASPLPVSQDIKSQELDNLELELDSLLENTTVSADVAKASEGVKFEAAAFNASLLEQENQNPNKPEPDKTNEQEELENWLDSII